MVSGTETVVTIGPGTGTLGDVIAGTETRLARSPRIFT